jgi:hypothetical protein
MQSRAWGSWELNPVTARLTHIRRNGEALRKVARQAWLAVAYCPRRGGAAAAKQRLHHFAAEVVPPLWRQDQRGVRQPDPACHALRRCARRSVRLRTFASRSWAGFPYAWPPIALPQPHADWVASLTLTRPERGLARLASDDGHWRAWIQWMPGGKATSTVDQLTTSRIGERLALPLVGLSALSVASSALPAWMPLAPGPHALPRGRTARTLPPEHIVLIPLVRLMYIDPVAARRRSGGHQRITSRKYHIR